MAPRRSTSILMILIGLFLTTLALAGLYLGDSTLFASQSFSLSTPEGDQLSGTYYPGNLSVAVLLVEGFGSDQVAMRSLANEFNLAGFNVFTFDFSGQGSSSGSLTFDYPQTDRLASEVLLVEKNIPAISGQDNLSLVVVGHGLGGRAALQSAVIDSRLVQGLVLIGPQVNLSANQQPYFFADVRDDSLPWVHLLNPTFPNTRILILSGAQDEIFTPDAGSLLMQALTNKRDVLPGNEIPSEVNQDITREWRLIPEQANYFEIYDTHIIDAALTWSQQILRSNPVVHVSPWAEMRGWLWAVGLAGIFVAAEGSRRAILHRIRHRTPNLHGLEIVNLRRFLLMKVIFWLVALPLMGLVAGLMLLIPLPKPIFNLYYVVFIGGYGLLMLILYSLGRMPGTHGKLQFSRISLTKISWRRVILTLEYNLAMLAILALFANSGWFAAPPGGVRLLWVLIFTPFTALGLWIGKLDIDLIIHNYPNTRISPALVRLNNMLPFFIYVIVMAVAGSTSGMISGLQGLVVLALVLLQGVITYRLTGSHWLTTTLQALMLYFLILPIGALFTFRF